MDFHTIFNQVPHYFHSEDFEKKIPVQYPNASIGHLICIFYFSRLLNICFHVIDNVAPGAHSAKVSDGY